MIFTRSIRAPSVTRICQPHDLTPDLTYRLEAHRGQCDAVLAKAHSDLTLAEQDAATLLDEDPAVSAVSIMDSAGRLVSVVAP